MHYGMRNHNTPFDWGSLKFLEFPPSKTLQTTRLYSPKFLQAVFNWNVELPNFDGIICQVQSPGELFTESADLGLAMKWSSTSEDARAKKNRAVGALLGKALDQIPLGEMGPYSSAFKK